MNKYHFHLTKHEVIFSPSEEEAKMELCKRYPYSWAEFELTDVEDIPAVPVERCNYCGAPGSCIHAQQAKEHLARLAQPSVIDE